MPDDIRLRADLERIFRAAVAAAAPAPLVRLALGGAAPDAERVPHLIAAASRVFVLAIGKAAAAMADAVVDRCGPKLAEALAIVPSGSVRIATNGIQLIEAAHPIPDASSMRAAAAALQLLERTRPGDLAIIAVSGGASAMFVMPAEGLTLDDKIAVNQALLRAGASIREFNCVRKHLSAVKGGRLLRAVHGAAVLGLVLSDVPGNDLATIGSGLTAADSTTYADAIAVLKRHSLWGRAPERVRYHLERGLAGEIDETVKPGDPALANVTNVIIGDNQTALDGARRAATELGYTVERLQSLNGEAGKVAQSLAAQMAALCKGQRCLLAGGEPTVTVIGAGRGGRTQHCALAFARELERIAPTRSIAALFAGTDGIDGPTDAAGAFVTSQTSSRARTAALDPGVALRCNDSHSFFNALGDLFITGPTGTNVNDIFVGLIGD